MKRANQTLLILIMSVAVGCTAVPLRSPPLSWESQLALWLEHSEFSKVEQWLRANRVSAAVPLPVVVHGEEITLQKVRERAAALVIKEKQAASVYAEERRWGLGIERLSQLERKLSDDFAETLREQIDALERQRDAYTQEAELNAEIEYAQWLSEQALVYQMQSAKRGVGSVWPRLRVVWNRFHQQGSAKRLLASASSALMEGDYLVANRIYGALSGFALSKAHEQQHVRLGYQLFEQAEVKIGGWSGDGLGVGGYRVPGGAVSFERRSRSERAETDLPIKKEARRIDEWVIDVDGMIREGRLVETQQLLMRLEALELNQEQQAKVQEASQYIKSQIALLNKHADDLYRKGFVSDAHSVWALLMQLDKDDANIRLKYYRSEKVLGNIQELREEGYYKTAPL